MDEKNNTLSNNNSLKNSTNSQLEITLDDIVRDRTILDKLDIIPNPFESQNNTRTNYPPFDDMFCSNISMASQSPFGTPGSKNHSNLSSSLNRVYNILCL